MRHQPSPMPVTRREALCRMGGGFGMLGFASLIGQQLAAAGVSTPDNPWMIRDPHFKPKAKSVIFLFMNGGMSQVDTFDPKPMLDKYNGQPRPGGNLRTERKTGNLMKSPFQFERHGESGTEISEIFPRIGSRADDICVIR